MTRRGVIAILLLVALFPAAPTVYAAEDYTRDNCPVVGNAKSRIYHTPASDDYRRMLKKNERGEDYRICFKSEQEAKNVGFRKSRK